MKKKLFVSAMSLVMAVILMTSTSFAWFTVSQQADATVMNVNLQATENVEIAKDDGSAPDEVTTNDTGDQYTWGNIVDYTGVDATMTNLATYTNAGLQTVTYSTADGRTAGLVSADPGTLASSTILYTHDSDKVGIGYRFWVRSNTGSVKAEVHEGTDGNYVLLKEGTQVTNLSNIAVDETTGNCFELLLFFNGDEYVAEDVDDGLNSGDFSITFELV